MSVAPQTSGDRHTRQRVLDVAAELFARHSYAGTSLQMIADELGFTKGAIYHHFRTREELLRALMEPMWTQLQDVLDAADDHRSVHSRAEHVLAGYATMAAANRRLVAMLSGDPGVHEMIRGNPQWSAVIERQIAVLAAVDPGLGGRVKAAVVMSGIAAAAGPRVVEGDADTLRDHLIEAGRRTLGLRTPRR